MQRTEVEACKEIKVVHLGMNKKLNIYLFPCIPNTIAFYSVLTSYSTIPEGSALIFNEVILNDGDGYVLISEWHSTRTKHVNMNYNYSYTRGVDSLFADMTVLLEYSRCPLMVMACTISPPIF